MLGRQGQVTASIIRPARAGAALHIRLIFLTAAILALSACQVPQGVRQAQTNSGIPSSPALLTPQKTEVSPAKSQPSIVAIAASAQNESAGLGSNPRLTGDPKEFIGLDHAMVRRALGDPLRIRSEQPAQVWQYATGDCIVDLYLYNLDGALKVTFVEARSHRAETEPTGRCLKSLLERPTAQAD